MHSSKFLFRPAKQFADHTINMEILNNQTMDNTYYTLYA